MNEKMLKSLYNMLGLSEKGIDFNKFATDMENNQVMHEAVFNKLNLKEKGIITLEEFQTDLGVNDAQEQASPAPQNEKEDLIDQNADESFFDGIFDFQGLDAENTLWLIVTLILGLIYIGRNTKGFEKELLKSYNLGNYAIIFLISAVLAVIPLSFLQDLGKQFFPVKDFGHFLTSNYFEGAYSVKYKFKKESKKIYYGVAHIEYTRMRSEDDPCPISIKHIETKNRKIKVPEGCIFNIQSWQEGELENGKPIYVWIFKDKLK